MPKPSQVIHPGQLSSTSDNPVDLSNSFKHQKLSAKHQFSFPVGNNRFRISGRTNYSAVSSRFCKTLVFAMWGRIWGFGNKGGIVILIHKVSRTNFTKFFIFYIFFDTRIAYAFYLLFTCHRLIFVLSRGSEEFVSASGPDTSLVSNRVTETCLSSITKWCCWEVVRWSTWMVSQAAFSSNGLKSLTVCLAKSAQTGKIVRPRKILFRKKRRHNRLTVSFLLMKYQVTWLWMASVLSFTRSNTSWGNWETLVIKTNSTIIVHSLKIIILFPHPINPIYGRQRSFEVPRSVKLHKSCPHRVADSLFTV